MAIREEREYRSVPMALFATEQRSEGDDGYMVEGYASTFAPYVLFKAQDGTEYKEQIDQKAFDEADMSDVIFCKDHQGTVFARTRNNTLSVMADEKGLYTRTNLSKTASAREMYEEIKAGMYDQMSFAFIVDDEEYDSKTHTRTIKRIGKVFDVSAVSFPANPGTDISAISARNYVNGVIEMEQAERLAEQKEQEEKRRLDAAKAQFYYFYALAGGKRNED